jgi:hypothetical protein
MGYPSLSSRARHESTSSTNIRGAGSLAGSAWLLVGSGHVLNELDTVINEPAICLVTDSSWAVVELEGLIPNVHNAGTVRINDMHWTIDVLRLQVPREAVIRLVKVTVRVDHREAKLFWG